MEVPFVNLKEQYKRIKNEFDSALSDIIENGNFILGKAVSDFESNISQYLNQNSLGCASGTDALLMALMALKIKDGDEVITTPFTFFATAGVIARMGAKPVFVDIDEKSLNIDINKIETKITTKTKAILPVHLFGYPVDMDSLLEIAHKKRIAVIEDACQAIGADFKGKKVGTFGDFGCFSFFPTKNLGGIGDGGLISCKKESDFQYLKKLRVHGSETKYIHEFVGINSRLDAIQAAILNVKLKYIDQWNHQRREIAKTYSIQLKKYVKTPQDCPYRTHIYHQYPIFTSKRDELLKHLNSNHIAGGIYYPIPLHLQKAFDYLGYKKGDFPISEKISNEILSLPIFPEMSGEQIQYVITNVINFFSK